ncbi:MAG: UDP-N-acetylglucosamine 2-epimerase (non-hydrolyzing) [Deltaproteobacteria bacterium]|nr:UDP-N-acetylglucosamine 2-epimerase (non-hydrolyzing) [Deltaproteobacteria bacterium]
MEKQIVTIVGARPQFVKAAVVGKAFQGAPEVRPITIHTGQHYDENMSSVFFEELGIPDPDFHLGIGSGPQGAQTGRMLEAIERTLERLHSSMVIVYGDTNSTLAGALAAAKLRIPVAHVEAGLRSFNRRMPEEINRVVTDHVANVLFAPTSTAVDNLIKEGLSSGQIHLVGDVMYDAALYYGASADRSSGILSSLGLNPRGYVLATVHRAENTDDGSRLRIIFEALCEIAAKTCVVWPLHPRTKAALVREGLLDPEASPIRFLEPVGYLDMVSLEKNARLIATDSGGVQKEAFFHRVPCVTLRDETEWVELIRMGWNRLAPPVSSTSVYEKLSSEWSPPPISTNPYGDGHAAQAIVDVLLRNLG